MTTSKTTPQLALEDHLVSVRDSGRKLLCPYVTAGIIPDWVDLIEALIDAGADGIEVGIPFSDPAMDGPTIQAASVQALDAGITPHGALSALRGRTFGAPLIAMTYYNLIFRYGLERAAADLAEAGIGGAILPDLPFEAAQEWTGEAERNGLANVLLASPVTSDERLAELGRRSRGFVYAVSTMGTTGERVSLDEAAGVLAKRAQAVTDLPVLIGFGISNPDHAVAASREADGVIVASALMRTLLNGGSIDDVVGQVRAMRVALDDAYA